MTSNVARAGFPLLIMLVALGVVLTLSTGSTSESDSWIDDMLHPSERIVSCQQPVDADDVLTQQCVVEDMLTLKRENVLAGRVDGLDPYLIRGAHVSP